MTTTPALEAFEGDWILARRIDDRLAGSEGRLEGRTSFTPDGDGLLYHEVGLLTLGDRPPMEASRRYFWRSSGDGIAVFFDDGRQFHQIVPDKLMPNDLHHCAPDMYHVTYDFRTWPDWSASWRVQGPRKDYKSVSFYRRA